MVGKYTFWVILTAGCFSIVGVSLIPMVVGQDSGDGSGDGAGASTQRSPSDQAKEVRRREEESRKASSDRMKEYRKDLLVFGGTDPALWTYGELYAEFAKKKHPVTLGQDYVGGGNDVGLRRMLDGTAAGIFLKTPFDERDNEYYLKLLAQTKRPPAIGEFATAAVAVITNKKNPVASISIAKLEDIYRGKIKQWKDVNGGSGDITRIGIDYPKLSWGVFLRIVLKGKKVEFEEQMPFNPKGNTQEEIDAYDKLIREKYAATGGNPYMIYPEDYKVISEVEKDPQAIGYCLVMPDRRMLEKVSVVAILSLDGKDAVTPTPENILLDRYPLQEKMFYMMSPEAPQVAWDFIRFVETDPAAAKIISSDGYYPASERERLLAQMRLAEAKAGKGVRISAGGLGGLEFGRDMAAEYVKARSALQLAYSAQQQSINIFNFVSGNSDFMIESEIATDTMSKVKDKWAAMAAAGMKQKPFAARAAAIVVNAANPAASLTADQLKEILSGKMTDWSSFAVASDAESKPAPTKISLLGLAANDATMSMVAQKISPARFGKYDAKKDAATLLTAVATDPGAIAIMDLTQVPTDNAAIRILPIGDAASPVAPSIATLKDGSYPLASLISIYYLPKPGPAPALVPATAPVAASAPTTTSAPTSAPAPDPLTELFKPLNQPVVTKSMTPSQTKEDFFNFLTAVLPDETSQPAGESSPVETVASKPAATSIMTSDAAASLQETLRKHGLVSLACPTIAQPSSAATQPAK